MNSDSRLSSILHTLLHMADANRPVTSAELAKHMNTNPVVVRRTMAGLREAGYVRSAKGRGGGWEIACDLEQVTLRQIYDALGAPRLLSIGVRLEHPSCLVEQSVNRALQPAFADAEALLIARLSEVTLARLAADFTAYAGAHRAQHKDHSHV
jgi:DNA-binding IscR family transcriptional regulator